jgi:repressor LexA
MSEPTLRQLQVLEFIRLRLAQSGGAPSLGEIAQALGVHLNAARKHVQALEAKGLLARAARQARGIRLPAALPEPALSLPLVGRVAAGSPILSDGNVEASFNIDPALFRPRPHFLLRVEGDSMIGIGIDDGDLIAVHRTPVAEIGQVVVARLDDEITVKRLARDEHGQWLLRSENPAYAPIRVDPALREFAIEGRYVGAIKRA